MNGKDSDELKQQVQDESRGNQSRRMQSQGNSSRAAGSSTDGTANVLVIIQNGAPAAASPASGVPAAAPTPGQKP